MSRNMIDGQMDFLGLLNEYEDDQGATVRVSEPKVKRVKPVLPVMAETRQIEFEFDPVPKQLSIDFGAEDGLEIEDASSMLKREEAKRQSDKERRAADDRLLREYLDKAREEAAPEKCEAKAPDTQTETKKEEVSESTPKELLFKGCKKCWCFTCKHNSRNDGIPREMCGTMMPCPACQGCISEDFATICEIGNAEEGCRTRAIEEGIIVPEQID